MNWFEHPTSRRRVLAGAAALAGAALTAYPGRPVRAARYIRVGTYGGFHQTSFEKHVFPDFVSATGIDVQSVAEPTGEAWIAELETAAESDTVPADVSMVSQNGLLRGEDSELWAEIDLEKIPNHRYLEPHFIQRDSEDRVRAIGALSWFITLATNTDAYPEPPTSWAELWNPRKADTMGLMALPNDAFLLEIAAATFFGGNEILATKDGILEVMAKIGELKPNVRMWYRDEGQFQQSLQSGEVSMGQYFHDVTGLAAAKGFPVRSTFPREGGVLDFSSWTVSLNSKATEETHVFIDYMSDPTVQSRLARKMGTAPTVARPYTNLSDEEFAAVSSDIPPIIPQYRIYQDWGDWLAEKWSEMIVTD